MGFVEIYKKRFKEDHRVKFVSLYIGLGIILLFFMVVSLAPTVGRKLGLIEERKEKQTTFADVPTNGKIRFLSKLTDLDSQWRNAGCSSSNLTCSVAQMMNASYEAIMVFDCSICREFGNAFSAGPSFVYQDPTMIRTDGSSDSPGVDLNDVLLTTTGQRCWQRFFNGSRYLADVTQQDVQDEIIAKLQQLVSNSAFDAIYIDVAEAYLPNAADCSGGTPAVSNAAWLTAWATLAERMQNEVPGPLILNSQYFTWNSLVSTSSTNADRFWAAPDAVEIEFGWPFGRHGEGTASGWQGKINYINRLHGLGTGVFVQDYPNGNGDFALAEEKYGLAMYLLAADAPDYYGTFNHDGHGSGFFSGYNADLGVAQGPFYTWNGLQRRDFASGFVLVNNPGGGTVSNIALGGSFTSLWGEQLSSITLGEKQGNIFRTPTPSSPLPVIDKDTDGDGFSDAAETFMGTDPIKACPATSIANDESIDAWPPDIDDDQIVDITDIAQLGPPVYESTAGDPNYSKRKDLNNDGVNNIQDVDKMAPPVFWTNCATSVQGSMTLEQFNTQIASVIGSEPLSSPLPVGDTQPPNVTISSPVNGKTVSGRVSINAAASDNTGVTKMEIYIDGSAVFTMDNVTSINYDWNTQPKKVASGSHTIEVKAYDNAGNVGFSSVSVTK